MPTVENADIVLTVRYTSSEKMGGEGCVARIEDIQSRSGLYHTIGKISLDLGPIPLASIGVGILTFVPIHIWCTEGIRVILTHRKNNIPGGCMYIYICSIHTTTRTVPGRTYGKIYLDPRAYHSS